MHPLPHSRYHGALRNPESAASRPEEEENNQTRERKVLSLFALQQLYRLEEFGWIITMASSMCAVGTSILDIGTRKASAEGPATEGQAGVPGMFGLPNVANVSFCLLLMFLILL